MKTTEDMVHEDPISKLEFIFIKIDGGEALTRVFIPFAQQKKTIYDPQIIKVGN